MSRIGLIFTAVALTASGCVSSPSQPPVSVENSLGDGPAAWVADAIAGDGPGFRRPSSSPAPLSVRNLPKSKRGNPSEYTVGGVRYAVLDDAEGFIEQGFASWYGRKFHGRETSSGERYDMYDMTAAHKHLPLPTFVRVTRTDTGDSIVVKVNDRGPFVPKRVIDLSYQAAATLGIVEDGTAPVIIEAISHHRPTGTVTVTAANSGKFIEVPAVAKDLKPQAQPQALAQGQGQTQTLASTSTSATATATASVGAGGTTSALATPLAAHERPDTPAGNYLQLGAFSQIGNAKNLIGQLSGAVTTPMLIDHDPSQALYKVWVGPIQSETDRDHVIAALEAKGVASFTMITLLY